MGVALELSLWEIWVRSQPPGALKKQKRNRGDNYAGIVTRFRITVIHITSYYITFTGQINVAPSNNHSFRMNISNLCCFPPKDFLINVIWDCPALSVPMKHNMARPPFFIVSHNMQYRQRGICLFYKQQINIYITLTWLTIRLRHVFFSNQT